MVGYLFRCATHGRFELRLPMGAAGAAVDCPDCGATARRVYAAPRLAFAPKDRMAVIERAERSATDPAVVSALPGRRRDPVPAAPADPALRRLPRP